MNLLYYIQTSPVVSWLTRIALLAICLILAYYQNVPHILVVAYLFAALLCSSLFCFTALLLFSFYVSFLGAAYYTPYAMLYVLVICAVFSCFLPSFTVCSEKYKALLYRHRSILKTAFLFIYLGLLLHIVLRESDWLQLVLLLLFMVTLQHAYVFLRFEQIKPATAVNALLLFFSILLGLFFMEYSVRNLYGAPPKNEGLYAPHLDYIFMLNPGGEATYRITTDEDAYKSVTYTISEQGFRDHIFPPKESDEIRVLLLGDSFTMGHAVVEDETISRHLERTISNRFHESSVTVINGGISAGGPLQELGMLKERGLALKPDCVVLQLFLINDFDDCLMAVGKSQRSFWGPTRALVNTLRQQHRFPYWLEYHMRQHSRLYNEFTRIMGGEAFIGDNLSSLRFFPVPKPVTQMPTEPDINSILDVNRIEWYSELHEGLYLLLKYVHQIHDLCRENDIGFSVYCVPAYQELSEPHWKYLLFEYERDMDFEALRALRIVEEHLKASDISVFSIEEPLLEAEMSIDELYYLQDGHFTSKGNRVVAKAIWEHLSTHCNAFDAPPP